jgi:tetratricopeptide (TPR) repeat protein
LELAVRYSPKSYEAHLNLGNAYRCGRKYGEALKEYETALTLDPKATDPIFNLAILYLDSDVKMEFDTKDALDSEKRQRLLKSIDLFQKYATTDAKDSRYERYLAEAEKALKKEETRLANVKKQNDRAIELEAKRKAKEAEEKEARERRQAEIQKLKVAGKSDVEDDPPEPEPVVTSTTATNGGVGVASENGGTGTPAPEPMVESSKPHMKKIAPKEDEAD